MLAPSAEMMGDARRHFRWRSLIVILLFLVFYFLGKTFTNSSSSSWKEQGDPIFNSTLGFSEILAIVLPGSDRRDGLLAAANAADLDITIFDGILPHDIAEADIPERWGSDDYKPHEGVLGCLMSHLKIWRRIIDENVSSALILESDTDFDLRVKQSMRGFSNGVKAIADFPFASASSQPKNTDIPYGSNWDLLWIGHCGAHTNGDGRSFAYEDSSAADDDHVWADYAHMADNYPRANGTRLVFQFRDVVCTVAYAISNAGARKMEMRFKGVNQPVDLEMLRQCTTDPQLICLASFPSIFGMVKDYKSNIDEESNNYTINEKLLSGKGIQISARRNAALGLAKQQPELWVKEWADSTM